MSSETDQISCDTELAKMRNECDHLEAGVIPNTEGKLSVIEFTYCPKCGEKL